PRSAPDRAPAADANVSRAGAPRARTGRPIVSANRQRAILALHAASRAGAFRMARAAATVAQFTKREDTARDRGAAPWSGDSPRLGDTQGNGRRTREDRRGDATPAHFRCRPAFARFR